MVMADKVCVSVFSLTRYRPQTSHKEDTAKWIEGTDLWVRTIWLMTTILMFWTTTTYHPLEGLGFLDQSVEMSNKIKRGKVCFGKHRITLSWFSPKRLDWLSRSQIKSLGRYPDRSIWLSYSSPLKSLQTQQIEIITLYLNLNAKIKTSSVSSGKWLDGRFVFFLFWMASTPQLGRLFALPFTWTHTVVNMSKYINWLTINT